MTSPALVSHEPKRRTRASERAISIALKAAKDAGLVVDKLSVIGGQVEIHFAGVDQKPSAKNYGGLDKW